MSTKRDEYIAQAAELEECAREAVYVVIPPDRPKVEGDGTEALAQAGADLALARRYWGQVSAGPEPAGGQ